MKYLDDFTDKFSKKINHKIFIYKKNISKF